MTKVTSPMEATEAAYEEFSVGSQGFCQYIATHSGLDMSHDEIERIANVAPNSSAFLRIWQDQTWWVDEE